MNISYRIELPCKVKDSYNELTFVNLVDLTKLVNPCWLEFATRA